MEVSQCPLTSDGWRAGGRRGQRRGFLLTHRFHSARRPIPQPADSRAGWDLSVIAVQALKFGSRFSRLFRPTLELRFFPRRAEKHLDLQSRPSCFDGVACVICKSKQVFNELVTVNKWKLLHLLVPRFIKRQIITQ